MSRILFASLMAVQLCVAADFVKQLTPKDLTPFKPSLPQIVSVTGTSIKTCALPLKQIRAGNGRRIDPMALPNQSAKFDRGINHAVPIPVCAPPGTR